jgi:hypothetical protein
LPPCDGLALPLNPIHRFGGRREAPCFRWVTGFGEEVPNRVSHRRHLSMILLLSTKKLFTFFIKYAIMLILMEIDCNFIKKLSVTKQ